MPNANINREFQSSNSDSLLSNDKAMILAMGEIYSNRNLALNVRTFTSTTTLDKTDTVCLCDGSSAFTLTLPPANQGSSTTVAKAKILIFKHISGTNNVTLTAASGDTVDGGASITFPPTGVFFLFSNGASTWNFAAPRQEASTWTPVDGSGAGLTLTVNQAYYSRIGNRVLGSCYVTYPATASGATALIVGLPYTAVGNTMCPVQCNAAGAYVTAQVIGGSVQPLTNVGGVVTNANLTGAIVIASFNYSA